MPSITLVRDAAFSDALRSYTIRIDGREVCALKRGEKRTVSVPAGAHTLTATIDWCGSKPVPFSLDDGQHATFAVRSNLDGLKIFAAMWYAVVARDEWLRVERIG